MNRNHWWRYIGSGISAREIEEQVRLERLEDGTDVDEDTFDDVIIEGAIPDISPEIIALDKRPSSV